MRSKFTAGIAIVALLMGASCSNVPLEKLGHNDQTRFEQQMSGYPDRDSSRQQNAAYTESRQSQLEQNGYSTNAARALADTEARLRGR
jgi:hypothetical protein